MNEQPSQDIQNPAIAHGPDEILPTADTATPPLELTEPLGGIALQAETPEDVNPNELRKKMDNALQRGTMADLEALFDSGVSVNQEDYQGRTALMLLTFMGRKDDVEKVLARGADVNRVLMFQDRIPMTALDAARQSGRREIADILVGLGAKSGKELALDQ